MIHAQELRFGNKVYNSQTGEIITVQQILHSTVVYDTQMKVNQQAASVGAHQLSYTSEVVEEIKEVEFTDLQPVALTPRLLQQCGFKNFIRDDWVISHATGYMEFEFLDKGLRLRQPVSPRIFIQCLHQLQNYYFALTGRELEVHL